MEFGNLKIKNIDCVVNYKADKNQWTAENRSNHIIGVKLFGKALHEFHNYKFTITKNCIYFLNQGDDYNVKLLEKGEVISVHFTTYEPISTDSFCIKLNNITEVIGLLEKIRGNITLSINGEHKALSDFYKLCSLFEEQRSKKYSRGDSRINLAKEYLDVHFSEKDCLNKASNISKISRRHFNELFKKQFNISPNRYVVSKKIDYAKQLILTSNLSISEISDMCGFSDVYYFSKVFKQETNSTPARFKNKKLT